MASDNEESNPIFSMLAFCLATGLFALLAVIFIPSISQSIIQDPVWKWLQSLSVGIFGLALISSIIALTSVFALMFEFLLEGTLVVSGNLMFIFACLGTILYGLFVALNWILWCISAVMA